MKRWTHKEVKVEAKKYRARLDFQQGSSGAYHYARNNGLLNKVCQHMEGGEYRRCTRKEAKKEAKKHTTRSEFFREGSGAYQYARREGVLDEICNHMKPIRKLYKDVSGEIECEYSKKIRMKNMSYNGRKRSTA